MKHAAKAMSTTEVQTMRPTRVSAASGKTSSRYQLRLVERMVRPIDPRYERESASMQLPER